MMNCQTNRSRSTVDLDPAVNRNISPHIDLFSPIGWKQFTHFRATFVFAKATTTLVAHGNSQFSHFVKFSLTLYELHSQKYQVHELSNCLKTNAIRINIISYFRPEYIKYLLNNSITTSALEGRMMKRGK